LSISARVIGNCGAEPKHSAQYLRYENRFLLVFDKAMLELRGKEAGLFYPKTDKTLTVQGN
nr:hypothetical protein [Methylococcales bacterium]